MAHEWDNETFEERRARVLAAVERLGKELGAYEYELTEDDIEIVSPHSFEDTQPAPRDLTEFTPTKVARTKRAG